MKKVFNYFVIFFLLSFFVSSRAIMVYDPAVQAAVTTSSKAQLVQMGLELKRLAEQAAHLKQALAVLSSHNWGEAQPKIDELGRIVGRGNAISYSAQNVDQDFRNTYPRYKPTDDYSGHYNKITNTTMDTLNNVLASMGSNANNFTNESERHRLLQKQSQSAKGQTQAIQAASQIASEEVTQLQLLRQTVIAQSNAQTAYYAAETQKDATREASLAAAVDNGARFKAPLIGHSGNEIQIPHSKR